MSEEAIDYEALCGRLVAENERLRKLSKPRVSSPPVGEYLLKAREFVEENYLVLMLLLFVVSSIIAGLYTVYQDRRRL